MAWTEERVDTLKKLWTEGLSASQIAKKLGGVTRNAVIGKVHRLGLSGRATPSRPPRRAVAGNRPRPAVRPTKAPSAPITRRTGVAPIRPPVAPALQPNGEFASVLTLSDHICRWPIGDPGDPNFQFCGRKAKAGSPYCEAHAQAAYQPTRKRRRAPEDADAALDAIAAARKLNW